MVVGGGAEGRLPGLRNMWWVEGMDTVCSDRFLASDRQVFGL